MEMIGQRIPNLLTVAGTKVLPEMTGEVMALGGDREGIAEMAQRTGVRECPRKPAGKETGVGIKTGDSRCEEMTVTTITMVVVAGVSETAGGVSRSRAELQKRRRMRV